MAKLLFFFNNGWVFGKIHNELIKVLHPEHYCDIFCWTNPLSALTVEYLADKYDAIMTTPEAAHMLHTSYGVPYDKFICVAHAYWDILTALVPGRLKPRDFDKFLGYAVTCPMLVNTSFAYGVQRVPEILPIGVFSENYKRPQSDRLQRIGYFGRYTRKQNDHANDGADIDIKRGYLAERVAEATGVELVRQENVHFLGVEGLYKSVDLVMFCSLIEGLPMVALEAFAAGLPVLGTDTGIFGQLARSGGGGVLPFAEDKFVAEAVEVVQALRDIPELYQRMSNAALEESKKHDWRVLKPIWLEYLQSL